MASVTSIRLLTSLLQTCQRDAPRSAWRASRASRSAGSPQRRVHSNASAPCLLIVGRAAYSALVGWVTQREEIFFLNAVYRCHQSDWDHFVSAPGAEPGAIGKLSLLADRLELFTADTTIAPGVDVRVAPGHTPGLAIVIVSNNHQRVMLLGGVVHCPMELTEPGWQTIYDVDPKLAQQTRKALMRELEGSTLPVAGGHSPGMRFGRLLADSGRSRWTST